MNDRPVLGGNNSSEIRVHLGGIIEMGPNQGLGRMIREFGHERSGNAQPGDYYEDQKKEDFINAEKNITLYASQRAVAVKMQRRPRCVSHYPAHRDGQTNRTYRSSL